MVNRLPDSKRKAFWTLESVTHTSMLQQREFLLMKEDRKYCTQCVYLFAVLTHD
ncbi:MAG: hypothetical protein ACMG6E_08190 [Candidatus Roizmanbacteria bacterium]